MSFARMVLNQTYGGNCLRKPLTVESLVSTLSHHTYLQAPGGNHEIETIEMEERRKEVK